MDAYVFSDLEGRPRRPDVCTNRFGRLRQRLGLSSVRLHDLRHFVATVLGDGGVPIATISSRLGHRDTATTLNIYTHALPATDQVAAAYLGSLLAPEVEGHQPSPKRSTLQGSTAGRGRAHPGSRVAVVDSVAPLTPPCHGRQLARRRPCRHLRLRSRLGSRVRPRSSDVPPARRGHDGAPRHRVGH